MNTGPAAAAGANRASDRLLSDFFGKWIVLCFYPGDFTFV